jgi:GSH-dependent disulfide-bond oxidoreductase
VITFYYNNAPNPMKVALFLEEAELEYTPVPVDTRKGEQFRPQYLALNPNAKAPTIVDGDATVFDSNAILLYLAEKTQRFLPDQLDRPAVRGQLLSWLMFVASGVGPFSGQAVHFRHYAPKPQEYALNRYDYEAARHWKIVDERLGRGAYMLGSTYSIVDMAVWGWARLVPHVLGDENAWTRLPNLKRLMDEVNARPAVARVEALRQKHAFKTEMDEEAWRYMFPQISRAAV